tara:strand:- start:436 stop:681 length:246 start_codon:yes stop_codon:yes gene_type:complete
MKLNKIEVGAIHKHLHIRELTDEGKYHRRVLKPDMDVSSEVPEIQEKAKSIWTNEVKDKWATFKEEQQAIIKSHEAKFKSE